MKQTPVSFSAALIFMLLNALIWLAFAVIIAAGLHPALPDSAVVKWVMSTLAFGAAGALLLLSFFLKKRSPAAFYLTIGLLSLFSVVTIFDQFGWLDLAVALINILPLGLLLKNRAWYLRRDPLQTNSFE